MPLFYCANGGLIKQDIQKRPIYFDLFLSSKKSTLKFKSAFLLYPTHCRTSHFPISYGRYPLQTPDYEPAIEELKQLLEAFMVFQRIDS